MGTLHERRVLLAHRQHQRTQTQATWDYLQTVLQALWQVVEEDRARAGLFFRTCSRCSKPSIGITCRECGALQNRYANARAAVQLEAQRLRRYGHPFEDRPLTGAEYFSAIRASQAAHDLRNAIRELEVA